MNSLTSAKRRTLRALAHSLDPVVIIGNAGLTPGVVAEVERSLKAHELIKIRVGGAEHAERESICETLCTQTGAAPVQHIGKILVIYRKCPKEESTKAAPGSSKPVKRSTGTDVRKRSNPRSTSHRGDSRTANSRRTRTGLR